MPTYRYESTTIDSDNPADRVRLEQLHSRGARLLCPCVDPPLEMYLARTASGIIVKRMPETGPHHAPSCPSWEPPPELGGLAPLIGQAIVENPEEGTTLLRLGFPLSRRSNRLKSSPERGAAPGDTVKFQRKKLTLRGLLHYLWDEARLTHWTPKWAGRRSWHVVQSHLLAAAGSKATSTAPLASTLYVAEPFIAEQKEAIADRRRIHLAKGLVSHGTGSKPLMILIGDVKEITAARSAFKIIVKHSPDFHFGLSPDLHTSFQKRFEQEIALWNKKPGNHLVVAATFSVNGAGYAIIEDITAMATNANWIPIEGEPDERLVTALTAGSRAFFKVLRYGLSATAPTATAVVVDTHPRPVGLYLLPSGASEAFRADLAAQTADSQFTPWFWDTATIAMPNLPPVDGYTAMAMPVLEPAAE
ncbi:protein of unknown function (plasmid) [Rhodovastum atsumiense]|nr:DUF1173 family protein [Rhodovastum atsumiense]CAH2605941.1 protein of unknown function [Rhodovastum atsumiense]